MVEYDLKDYQSGGVMRQIITALIAAVVLGVIPLIVCARLFDIPRRRRQQPQESDNVDGDYTRYESPRSPPGSLTPAGFPSPQSVTLSRSPPQPYTDYVSKTIDHTPYFRREGLRRYDPSRTYWEYPAVTTNFVTHIYIAYLVQSLLGLCIAVCVYICKSFRHLCEVFGSIKLKVASNLQPCR
jgi:hypothetical protein